MFLVIIEKYLYRKPSHYLRGLLCLRKNVSIESRLGWEFAKKHTFFEETIAIGRILCYTNSD